MTSGLHLHLAGMWQSSSTEWSAAFSTHAIIAVTFQFQMQEIEGAYLKTVLTEKQEENALTEPDWAVWEEPVNYDVTAQELFRVWLSRMNRFLRLPQQSIGRRQVIHKTDKQDGVFQVNVRAFKRANLAKKVNAWFQELANLHRQRAEDYSTNGLKLCCMH